MVSAVEFKTYGETCQAIEALGMSVHKLGTQRIKRVLARLGQPQNQVACIHVVGTNGKGSVSTLLESIYRHAGYKVGLFTSPHLIDMSERLQINRQLPTEAEFVGLANQVFTAMKQCSTSPQDALSFFEFLNTMAFLWFAQAGADIAIIEAGLGGRLDSTNVIESPSAVVVTPISLDHIARLGPTLEAITREKMAVFRPGVPVITGGQKPEVVSVLKAHAESLMAPLTLASDADWTPGQIISGGRLPRRHFSHRYNRTLIECGLLGTYQKTNIAIAMAVIDTLSNTFSVKRRALDEGLANAYWPARYHWLPQTRILIDGSHNREGIEALIESVRHDFGTEQITWALSLKKNRPLSTFDPLLQYALTKGVLVIEPERDKDSYHAAQDYIKYVQMIRPELNQHWDLQQTLTPAAYMAEAMKNTYLKGVTGSLYVAGEFLKTVT